MHLFHTILLASLLFLQVSVARPPTPEENGRIIIERGSPQEEPQAIPNDNCTTTLDTRAPAIPAWKFYVNRDHDYHQQQYNELAPAGWRMLSLSVYGSPLRYAAVWVQRPGPGYTAIHGASAAAYQTWFDDWSARGFVSTIVTVTGPADSPTYAGVMEDIRVPSWWQRCGLSRADFEALISQRRSESMLLKSFQEYGTPTDRRYCGLWHGSTTGFEKYNAWPGLSYTDYQLLFNAETQKRYWRPAYLAESEDHQLSSLFADTSIGPWIARHGLTANQLDAQSLMYMANSMYPIQIQGGGSADNARFAAIFARQDTPTPREWNVSGPAPTGFKDNEDAAASVDGLMQTFMQTNGVRQAQVSIGKGGNVLLERGYTWAEPDRHRTQPADRFLLASVSKMFVAGCIQHMYDTGQLNRSTRVYPLLGYNKFADPRTGDITVEHLVFHQGGYDRSLSTSPDPIFLMREIAQARGGTEPANVTDVIDSVVYRQLDFTPGYMSSYSNYGYMLLAYLVERVSGLSYPEYLRRNVLGGLDVVPWATNASAHVSDPIFQETTLLGPDAAAPQSELLVPGVYGGDGIYKESALGPSAMSCSASTLVRYISTHAARYTGPRTPGSWHEGAMAGARSFDASREDGVDWAVVLNTGDLPNDANFGGLIDSFNAYLDSSPVL